MARSTLGADASTRAYLLGQAREFCTLMVTTMLNDGTESARYASEQLGPRVDALAVGEPVLLARYELPPGHPSFDAGNPGDSLVLGTDDIVRER